mgnify:CR=1 FL=1
MGLSEHALDANDEWCTPPSLFLPMVWGWGGIDLDPFGHFTSKIPATERWTLPEKWAAAEGLSDEEWTTLLAAGYVEGDAQQLEWNGRVFANGPYSNVAWWLSRAADAAEQEDREHERRGRFLDDLPRFFPRERDGIGVPVYADDEEPHDQQEETDQQARNQTDHEQLGDRQLDRCTQQDEVG